jgi:hypothetical protein
MELHGTESFYSNWIFSPDKKIYCFYELGDWLLTRRPGFDHPRKKLELFSSPPSPDHSEDLGVDGKVI